jgi:hypothetical protein
MDRSTDPQLATAPTSISASLAASRSMTFSGTITRIASSTSVFGAMVCAQCDEWQCSARNRGRIAIPLAERKPARPRMDPFGIRGIPIELHKNTVKQIRHDGAIHRSIGI